MFRMSPIQFRFKPAEENRCIVAEPSKWSRGYGILFMIEIENRIIECYEYFDEDVDSSLSLLLEPLYKGEIRGRYAEELVWTIFFRLCRNEDWLKDNFLRAGICITERGVLQEPTGDLLEDDLIEENKKLKNLITSLHSRFDIKED